MANGEILRGEVWWVSLDDSVGCELKTGRPAVVLSSRGASDERGAYIVSFLTSSEAGSPFAPQVVVKGETKRVLCNQLRTLDVSRFTRHDHTLTPDEMKRVTGALANAMCIPIKMSDTDEKIAKLEQEVAMLKLDVAMWQRMYERTMDRLCDIQIDLDVAERKKKPIPEPEDESPVVATSEKVNLNTATAQEFHEMLGISMEDAYAIVGYRKKNGLFVELEELADVRRFSLVKAMKYFDRLTLGEEPKPEPEPEPEVQEDIPEKADMPKEADIPEKVNEPKRVNLNRASMKELMNLGFSKPASAKIIHHRRVCGPFREIDELMTVDEVSAKDVRKLRDKLEI